VSRGLMLLIALHQAERAAGLVQERPVDASGCRQPRLRPFAMFCHVEDGPGWSVVRTHMGMYVLLNSRRHGGHCTEHAHAFSRSCMGGVTCMK
jgi:hypothetical protein